LLRFSYIPAPWSIYERHSQTAPRDVADPGRGQREPRAEPYWSVRQAVEVGMKNRLPAMNMKR